MKSAFPLPILLALALVLSACGGAESRRPKQMTSPAPMPDPLVEACEGGVAKSCLLAGDDYEKKGRVADAITFYQKACDAKDRDGCLQAGGLLIQEPSGQKRGIELLTGACDAGDPAGCHGAALALEGAFGGEADEARAALLYRRACDDGYGPSCGKLGAMTLTGRGIAADDAAGRELLIAGCNAQDGRSCVDLARLMLQKQEASGSVTILQRACEMGEGTGCTELGFSYSEGRGVEASAESAREMFRRGCEADLADPRGCTMLGWSEWEGIGGAPESTRGKNRLTAACEDDGLACYYLARIAREQGDLTTSKSMLDQACGTSPMLCDYFKTNIDAVNKK